jgi:hypothetical protein
MAPGICRLYFDFGDAHVRILGDCDGYFFFCVCFENDVRRYMVPGMPLRLTADCPVGLIVGRWLSAEFINCDPLFTADRQFASGTFHVLAAVS